VTDIPPELEPEDAFRFEIISKTLSDPAWTAQRAAEVLHLTMRQVFRLKARIQRLGPTGVMHASRGRHPVNAKPIALRERVIRIYKKDFAGENWNYDAFTEMLAEQYDVNLSRETIRNWLRAAGEGHKVKRYRHHRHHRERCARMGQMLFLDGSPHRWFGPDGPRMTLILATDDATGQPLYGLFKPQETRDGCFEVFYHLALHHGLPESLYLDRASQFTTTRHGGIHAHQVSEEPTAFEIAMQKLKVQIIFANSPQARGRGERMNGTFQGRLVAELRHEQITDPAPANRYLNDIFIPRIVRRFGVSPRDSQTAFRPIPAGLDLRTVLCVESIRVVESDNTIALHGYRYQLQPPRVCPTLCYCRVRVQEWFDQSVHVYHQHFGEIPNVLIPHRDVLHLKYPEQGYRG
jgi:hypothetical protein